MNQPKYLLQPLTFLKPNERPISKPLPLTPGSAMISSLELENETLRRENISLRRDVQISRERLHRYRKITVAAKAFFRQTTIGAQKFEDILHLTQQEKESQYPNLNTIDNSDHLESKDTWV